MTHIARRTGKWRRPTRVRPSGRALPFLETLEARRVPSFLPPFAYDTGASPRAVLIGDLNGDSVPDLVVANYTDGTVSVFLGVGDGTFEAAGSFPTGPTPNALALGDVNGDGIPDLALTNRDGNTVSILLGNGDGSFAPPVPYGGPAAFPDAVVLGDFNGDGAPDLASVAGGSRYLGVRLNNGDGTFGNNMGYNVGTILTGLAVGDFNGDGTPDLAVGSLATSQVIILLGNGDGTFQVAESIHVAGVDQVATADLNGDGTPDLVVSNTSGTVNVLLGNGDGTFQAPVAYPANGGSVAVADVNGDGVPDLVTAGGTTIDVLLGVGDGTFQAARSFDAGPDVSGVAAMDLTGDGYADVVVTNASANTASVLRNDSQWNSPGPTIPMLRPEGAVESLPIRPAVSPSVEDQPPALGSLEAATNQQPFLPVLESGVISPGKARPDRGSPATGQSADKADTGAWLGLGLLSPADVLADSGSPTGAFMGHRVGW